MTENAAPRVTLVDGDSLDYIDGKAVLTLHSAHRTEASDGE